MSTLKLYYSPKTRSTRPRWLLEEMGIPYDLIRINLAEKQQKSAAYFAIQPHGWVPALEDDGTVIFESAAVMGYLADKFPEKKMAPALGTKERALYWQWMMYGVATLEVPIMIYFGQTVHTPEVNRTKQIVEDSLNRFRASAEVLSSALTGKSFLVADTLSAADVLIGSLLFFAKALKMPLADYPVLVAYTEALKARPAFKKAIAD